MAPSPASNRRPHPGALLPFLSLLLLSLLPLPILAEPTSDRSSLLAFLSTTPHSRRRITWDSPAAANSSNTTACLWRGVTCNPSRTAVVAIRLPGTGLSGPIPSTTPLANLTSLRYLSLRSNALSGPLPETLMAMPNLRGLYLQRNKFAGEIPPRVTKGILRLDLSQNRLTGTIPEEFGNLTALTGLFLQGNQLSGEIPAALGNLDALVGFNVSGNRLKGPIPDRLGARFPASAFAGNIGLCGKPLPPCAPGPAAPPAGGPGDNGPAGNVGNGKGKKRLSTAAIIAIAAGGGGLLLLAAALILAFCCRRRLGGNKSPKPAAPTSGGARSGGGGVDTATTSSTSKDDITGRSGARRLSADKRNKLVVLDASRDWYSFDLEDLLRASAEVLGKGALGTSYKATLEDGAVVVVKRLRGENAGVGKAEFEACMKAVARGGGSGGDGGHPNVQALRAYYYSKDEKLLLFDHVPGGSLSATLHANRSTGGRTFLEWPSRLRIALTASHGLLHLHNTANLVHGNLKASNVLLRRDPDGAAAAVLTDYALHPLFGPTAPHTRGGARASGYRAPEVKAGVAPTPAADVYGYGVLVLELLTGRSPGSPAEESTGGGGSVAPGDLPRWVRSVVREEWTVEVIDRELVRYGSEEEMVRLLHVALVCTETNPAERPTTEQVVRLVEDLAASAAAAEGDESGTGRGTGVVSSSDDPASEANTPHAQRTP